MQRQPNPWERRALRKLSISEWEYRAQMYCGEKTFNALVEAGWVTAWTGNPMRDDLYCITEAGRAALAQQPQKPLKRKPLKVVPSRLKQVESRLERAKKGK